MGPSLSPYILCNSGLQSLGVILGMALGGNPDARPLVRQLLNCVRDRYDLSSSLYLLLYWKTIIEEIFVGLVPKSHIPDRT